HKVLRFLNTAAIAVSKASMDAMKTLSRWLDSPASVSDFANDQRAKLEIYSYLLQQVSLAGPEAALGEGCIERLDAHLRETHFHGDGKFCKVRYMLASGIIGTIIPGEEGDVSLWDVLCNPKIISIQFIDPTSDIDFASRFKALGISAREYIIKQLVKRKANVEILTSMFDVPVNFNSYLASMFKQTTMNKDYIAQQSKYFNVLKNAADSPWQALPAFLDAIVKNSDDSGNIVLKENILDGTFSYICPVEKNVFYVTSFSDSGMKGSKKISLRDLGLRYGLLIEPTNNPDIYSISIQPPYCNEMRDIAKNNLISEHGTLLFPKISENSVDEIFKMIEFEGTRAQKKFLWV
nr:hypothetical protein [Candidatus Sigynarchaeota archaeon]